MNEAYLPSGFSKVEESDMESLLSSCHNRTGYKFFGGEIITIGENVFSRPVLDSNGQKRIRNGQPQLSISIQAEIDGKDFPLSLGVFSTFPRDVAAMVAKYPFMKQLTHGSDWDRYQLLKGRTFKVELFKGEGIDWSKFKEGDKGDALVWKEKDFPMFIPQ